MKKLNAALLLSLFLLLIVSCTSEKIQPQAQDANDVILKKADKFKTFHATFDVIIDTVLQIPPPLPKIQIVLGEGQARHMGNTEVSILQNWWPPGPPPLALPYCGSGTGEVTFTAANGDLLYAIYDDAEGCHALDGLVYVTYTAYFTGGTGRFEDALGCFYWDGIYNPALNEGTAVCTGEIMY